MKKIIDEWKYELLIMLLVLFSIFEIFFQKDGFKPMLMALAFFIFILIPGMLLSILIFNKKIKKYEHVIVGFAFGLIVTPLIIYFVNLFEVIHAKYLGFIIPIILIGVLGYLNYKNGTFNSNSGV
ncbi:hypothetical protein ACFLZX_06075 [Nanoarchaeota archaeon]